MTLNINDLKNGTVIKIEKDPYVVLSIKRFQMGRGGANANAKVRNLKTGQVLEKTFKPADEFEEAEVEKMKSRFLYSHKEDFWFNEPKNPKNRFMMKSELIGDSGKLLKSNMEIIALKFDDEIIGIELPIKGEYKVVEAPPAIRGNTAQGGTKTVVIETGAKVSAPLFINEGDIIRINTATGEYAERVEKA